MISTPTDTLLLLAVGVSGDEEMGASGIEAIDGQMTNSTIRDGSEGDCAAKKSRP